MIDGSLRQPYVSRPYPAPGPHWFALLAPPGGFYRYLLQCLKEAMDERGYFCAAATGEMPRDELASWAGRYRPTAVLEINRVLGADEPWPRGCLHLAWIRDYRFAGLDLTRLPGDASDHLYFLMYPEQFGLDRLAGRSWSVLLPAARPQAALGAPAVPVCDFALCGYMPPPLDSTSTVSFMPDGRPVALGDFLEYYPEDALGLWRISLSAVRRAIAETCEKLGCAQIEAEDIVQVFDHVLPRIQDRRTIVEAALSVSDRVRLYGPATWQEWHRFAPYWRGYVEDPARLDAVYRTARVNLHNSMMGMHARVVDCIAAGGFVMIHPTPYDSEPYGIRRLMEPDRHYGLYEMSSAAAAARRYLEDEPLCRSIAAAGRRLVLAEHTWPHRAEQILRDLGLPAHARGKAAVPMRLHEASAALAGLAAGAAARAVPAPVAG